MDELRLRDGDGNELEALFGITDEGETTLLTIESQGGGRNKDHIHAFGIALERSLKAGWSVEDAFLASTKPVAGPGSKKYADLPEDDRRIFDRGAYPATGSGTEIAKRLRTEAGQMFRDPRTGGRGNPTRRLQVRLKHTASDRFLASDLGRFLDPQRLPSWADENVIVQMKIGEAAAADPEARTEGLQRHAVAQNLLTAAYLDAGGTPFHTDVNVDAAWTMLGSDVIYVAEVKGITQANQVGQLRLGLGQVIDFAVEIEHLSKRPVKAVLFVSEEPTANRWFEKCERSLVELAWPTRLPKALA